MKNGQIFLSKIYHFKHDHRFHLIEKWGTLDIARRYDCRNALNLGYQDSICFRIFQVV